MFLMSVSLQLFIKVPFFGNVVLSFSFLTKLMIHVFCHIVQSVSNYCDFKHGKYMLMIDLCHSLLFKYLFINMQESS